MSSAFIHEFQNYEIRPKRPLVQADLVTLKKSSGLLFCLSKALGDRRKE